MEATKLACRLTAAATVILGALWIDYTVQRMVPGIWSLVSGILSLEHPNTDQTSLRRSALEEGARGHVS